MCVCVFYPVECMHACRCVNDDDCGVGVCLSGAVRDAVCFTMQNGYWILHACRRVEDVCVSV